MAAESTSGRRRCGREVHDHEHRWHAGNEGGEARALALSLYRAAGYGPDDFARSRAARMAMADALTRTEDHLEIQGARRDAERGRIRAVRRRLEATLWPRSSQSY